MPDPLTFEQWSELHKDIFTTHGFPVASLSKILYTSLLSSKDQDFSLDFAVDSATNLTKYVSSTAETLQPVSKVFFFRHLFSDEPMKLIEEWKKNSELRAQIQPFIDAKSAEEEVISVENLTNNICASNQYIDIEDIEEITPLYGLEHLRHIGIKKNTLSSTDIELLHQVLPHLKSLSIKGASVDSLESQITTTFTELEVLNGCFLPRYTDWALKHVSNNFSPETVTRLDLSTTRITQINREAFRPFKNLHHVNVKGLKIDCSDAKAAIPSLLSIECDEPSKAEGEFVFINGIDKETGDTHLPVPDLVWDHTQVTGKDWAIGNSYAMGIQHSTDPTFGSMPAGSPHLGETFWVIWPVKEVHTGDAVTSNLYPNMNLEVSERIIPVIPKVNLNSKFRSTVTRKRPIKAYIEYPPFVENLHSEYFEITDDPHSADLLWLVGKPTYDFGPIYTNGILFNQIEGEMHITVKDLLYQTVIETLGPVDWLPETYVLNEEGEIGRFLQRHEQLKQTNQSAAWVVKAFNSTRADKMIVTESSSEVLRHVFEHKYRLAQRYLWNPLNIFGQKFDLRFIILVKSLKPFELYVYKAFWPRLSPKKWAPCSYDDYERHFTVMNYRAPSKVTSKTYVDFIEQFQKENPHVEWDSVRMDIYKAIRDLIVAGAHKMKVSPFCKAMYGIDVMITNEYKPFILECNYLPDCKRACNLCPSFVDDVFEVLYVQQPVTNENVDRILL